jgi:hypothetical protein
MSDIEYRVRPITKYELSEWYEGNGDSGHKSVGTFSSLKSANEIGNGMAQLKGATFHSMVPPAPKVRAKFTCTGIMPPHSPNNGSIVSMNAVWAGADENGSNLDTENHIFSKATPSAHMQMEIRDPTALACFVVGKKYYLDFTPVE